MRKNPRSLASDNYLLRRKNARFDIIIFTEHPWGGRFQPLKIEGDQEAGGNGRNPSGQEGYIGSICEVFGSMLTVGS